MSLHGWSSHLTAGQVSVLSANADQRVIVLLRNQHTALTGRSAEAQRAHAFAADRAPIVAQLHQLHAPRVVAYRTLNAVATTVSAAEAANLRSDPAVLAVDPDVVVKGPSSNADLLPGATRASLPRGSGDRRLLDGCGRPIRGLRNGERAASRASGPAPDQRRQPHQRQQPDHERPQERPQPRLHGRRREGRGLPGRDGPEPARLPAQRTLGRHRLPGLHGRGHGRADGRRRGLRRRRLARLPGSDDLQPRPGDQPGLRHQPAARATSRCSAWRPGPTST